jgi:hypothetical protein
MVLDLRIRRPFWANKQGESSAHGAGDFEPHLSLLRNRTALSISPYESV